jgi:hypothetical protein
VSNASQPAIPVCNHERRPGTTVCLHCRHAARAAAAERRKKLAFRGTALAIVVAIAAVTASLGANELRGWLNRKSVPDPAQVVASSAARAEDSLSTNVAPVPVAQQGDIAPASPAPLIPVIAAGESQLAEGLTATRSDSGVTLGFDTPMLRTRMPDKFERFLRATLRQVYGPGVEGALASLPEGSIAAQGNLLEELPTRGIHIPVSDGWTIIVFPETRPGQDGPLVVRYRVAVTRN